MVQVQTLWNFTLNGCDRRNYTAAVKMGVKPFHDRMLRFGASFSHEFSSLFASKSLPLPPSAICLYRFGRFRYSCGRQSAAQIERHFGRPS